MCFHIIFSAEAIGYTKIVPAFLDPNLKPKDLLHGVSFASAASGYDDLTANLSVIKVLLTCIKLIAIRKGPFMSTNMSLFFFFWSNFYETECIFCYQTAGVFHALSNPYEKFCG